MEKPHKLTWLQNVACDPQMRGLPTSVAVLLGLHYFNSNTGLAWPSQDRLAHELGADYRNIQRALDRLVDAGWLERKSNRGRGRSNNYWMAVKHGVDAVPHDIKHGVHAVPPTASTPCFSGEKHGAHAVRKKRSKTGRGTRERPRQVPVILNAEEEGGTLPSAEQLETAERLAGWEPERARREWEGFTEWHTDHQRPCTPSAWRSWCQKGAVFDQRDGTRCNGAGSTGFESAVEGLQDWVNAVRKAEQTEH